MSIKITITHDISEAKENRFKKFFRFDNSNYWLDYYAKKLKSSDVIREKLYAGIITKYSGKGSVVVDMASGMGFLLKALFEEGAKAKGVDLFEEMIESARKYLKGTKIEILNRDVLDSGLKSESVDAITMVSIVEHFPKEEIETYLLPEMRRVLKSGGYLLVHCPVRSLMSRFARFIRMNLLRDLPEWAIDDDGDITHKVWLTGDEYIRLFEMQGFTLVNFDSWLTRSNLKPRFVTDIMKVLERIFGWSDMELSRHFKDESLIIKNIKKLKCRLALTSYFLFRKQ